ncbi:MAG: hypothetical protein GZ091_10585 [Paludibacter sp.]|nr:hypothetical protein [Paludibacter sp.]
MKIYFVLCVVFALSIPSLFAQDSVEVSTNKATVYIVRNNFLSELNALIKFDFYNNDSFIGRLKVFQYLKLECNAGKQLFWTAADNKNFLEVDLMPGETYIIEAKYSIGIYNSWAKLKLVPKNSDDYNFLKQKIISKEPVSLSADEIQKKNNQQKNYILKSVEKYEKRKIREASFKNDTITAVLPNAESNSNHVIRCPIILDYTVADFPFSNKSMEISGVNGLISNPSMSQSLNIATSVNSLTREGIYRLMTKHPATKRLYKFSAYMVDFLSYLPIPLTSGWMHEEFHRAVLAKHGGNSYNEMNNFPIFKSLISVLDVKDEDLIRLKRESPQDMVRMSEAGIEGQYLMTNVINNSIFFYKTKSISLLPFLSNLNSIAYVMMCSGKNIDKSTNSLNEIEGSSIAKRDLVGLDFLSYTYDLFRPNEPYESRGIHPSGVGIDRYIKRSQLTTEELSYLKQQGWLQLINLANPISLKFNSFNLGKAKNGEQIRGNLYFNHWLTAFGYDISTTGLLHYNTHNYAFTIHNYANHKNWYPGLEVETFDYKLGEKSLKNSILFTGRVMAWLQPENQLFFSNKAQLGGLIETKIQYPISKHIYPYISVTAKTNGWVAGNVYLEKNISSSFGIRAYF